MPSSYLPAIRAEGEALVDAARGGLAAGVPSCPDWTVAKLLRHVSRVHRWVAEMVRTGACDRVDASTLPRPPEGGEVEWYVDGLATLLDTLSETDPERPVWNWSGVDQHAAWWHRRMAHETAVHRWDAQDAVGDPAPVEAELAADGVDEVLQVHRPSDLADEPVDGLDGRVRLHCTDTGDAWYVALHPIGVDVRRVSAAAVGSGEAQPEPTPGVDATAEGPASELLLALWGRRPWTALTTSGDPVLLDACRTS